MKRWLVMALWCALIAAGVSAQVAVTGNLKTAGVVNATGQNTYVSFTLTNFGGAIPTVIGSNMVAVPYVNMVPDVNGNISGTVQGNDTLTPAGTFYQVCIYFQGNQFRCQTYLITGSTFNLNTATPLNIIPVVGPNQIITSCFPFLQQTPATTWTVTHNENDLNVFVTTTDLSGNTIFPDLVNTGNPNVATITWVEPQAGKALVCHGAGISIATNQPNAVLTNSPNVQTVVGPGALNVSSALGVSGSFSVSGPTAFSGSGNTGTLTTGSGILNTANIFTQSQTAPAWISSTANAAQSGIVRLAPGDAVSSRDVTNSFDIALIQLGPTILSAPTIELGAGSVNEVQIGGALINGNASPEIYGTNSPLVGAAISVTLQASNAGSGLGSAAGGSVNLSPGTGRSSGAAGVVHISAITTASLLPACTSSTEGSLMPVSDSTVSTWGSTFSGSGSNHILAYCDGTNWTVAAI